MKRRRLNDLFVTGKPCVLDDGQGDPVEFWIQKISPTDHEVCLRRANAARARILMLRNDSTDEEWRSAYSMVADDTDPEVLVGRLISEKVMERRQALGAQIAAEEEWSKDDYLQGLSDAWEGDEETTGLKDDYALGEESEKYEEASRVFNELKKYNDLIEAQLEPEIADLRASYEMMPLDELCRRAVENYLTNQAEIVWMTELTRNELLYAIRDPEDHKKRYFENRAQLDELQGETLQFLVNEWRSLVIDPVEGKDSEATDISSVSSEQPATEDPASPSGHLAAVQ